MEEFGKHCEFAGCNALDFLPFKCPGCCRSHCLTHSSRNMHACSGTKRDATSVDCPVCSKSVVFNRGEDVNLAWEQHYVTACTQQVAKATETARCALPSCRVALKDSTTRVSCGRCRVLFCLAHRVPEDHGCAGLRGNRDAFLSKLANAAPRKAAPAPGPAKKTRAAPAATSTGTSTGTGTSTQLQRGGGSGAGAGVQPDGKSQSSMSAAVQAQVLECPFCARADWESVPELEAHVRIEHAETSVQPTIASAVMAPAGRGSLPVQAQQQMELSHNTVFASAAPTASASASASGLAREACPLCQQRFADAIALVAHFESAHGGGGAGSGGSAGAGAGRTGNKTGGEKCSID